MTLLVTGGNVTPRSASLSVWRKPHSLATTYGSLLGLWALFWTGLTLSGSAGLLAAVLGAGSIQVVGNGQAGLFHASASVVSYPPAATMLSWLTFAVLLAPAFASYHIAWHLTSRRLLGALIGLGVLVSCIFAAQALLTNFKQDFFNRAVGTQLESTTWRWLATDAPGAQVKFPAAAQPRASISYTSVTGGKPVRITVTRHDSELTVTTKSIEK